MSTNLTASPKPLVGKTILVTRSIGQSSQFTERLTATGANVIEMPALEIGPPSSWDALDNAIAHLSDFDWLILTSTNGVDYFFERMFAQSKDARILTGIKIAVVGEKTAQRLQQHCLIPDFIPPNFVADSLVEHFPEELSGKKILFPRVETGGREVLLNEFMNKGAEVIDVAAYQSCCPSSIPPSAKFALQSGNLDVITFASSKTVKFFCELTTKIFSDNFKEYHQENRLSLIANLLEGVCIASIGPQTSKDCRSLIGRVDVEAEEYTLDGLTQALIKWAESS
jgi:uroporphyrinogen-III synthase